MRDDFAKIQEVLHEMSKVSPEDLQEQFFTLLDEMEDLMVKKGEDYSGKKNHTWYSFDVTSDITGLTVDQVFLALIGTKFSRLVALIGETLVPNNESLNDTFLDFANYLVLWVSYKNYLKGQSK